MAIVQVYVGHAGRDTDPTDISRYLDSKNPQESSNSFDRLDPSDPKELGQVQTSIEKLRLQFVHFWGLW